MATKQQKAQAKPFETVDAFEAIGGTDAEAGIIRGVKLLGLRSRNKRNYDTPGVRRDAASKFVGTPVFFNHPNDPSSARSYADKFGVVESYEYRPGAGHFGDIKVNLKHSLAEQFLYDVTHMPRTLGMSINGRVKQGSRGADGDVVVEGLDQIRSVDIVTRPATTDGIFEHETESEDEMPLTVEELREKHPEIVEQIAREAASKAADVTEQQKLQAELAATKQRLEAMEAEQAAVKLRAQVKTQFASVLEGLSDEDAASVLECACESVNRDNLLKAMTAVKSFTPTPEEEDEPALKDEPLVREQEEPAPARVGKTSGKTGSGGGLRGILRSHGIGKQ